MRAASGEQWTIAASSHEAVVVEVGGGLRTYTADGVDILDGYQADEICPGYAGTLLAPWPNRIRDGRYSFAGKEYRVPLNEPDKHNALHGLAVWGRWRATAHSADSVTVEYDLPPTPGYPWALALAATYSVGADGLTATHAVTNVDATACPFGFSVHPYLFSGAPVADTFLQIPARSRLLLDGRLLPIGAAKVAGTEYDFTAPRRIGSLEIDCAFGDVVRDAQDGTTAVTVSTSEGTGARLWADAAFGWWQIYTGDTLAGERFRRSVAVEPMTCPPDSFRSGRDLIVLEPGQTWRGTWGVQPLR
jgi:aldose 1-epimerase